MAGCMFGMAFSRLFTAARRVRREVFPESPAYDECMRMNTQRIFYGLLVMIPLSLLLVLRFYLMEPGQTSGHRLWMRGVLCSNGVLLLGMLVLFEFARRLRRKEPGLGMLVLQHAAVALVMACGVAVSAFDQLVAGGITPYMGVCIMTGMFLLLRPSHALIIYSAAYAAFYLAVAVYAGSPEALLISRGNGMTVSSMGLLLSLLNWRSGCVNIQQRQHIERQKQRLEQLAYYDSLTGLSNRRFFDEMIKKELPVLSREGCDCSLIILDVDDFKRVNDTHGHPAGDCLLRQLAQLLESSLRRTDVISRLGGEEFIIFLPKTSLREAAAVAEKLRRNVYEHVFVMGEVRERITASFGVSLLPRGDEYAPCNYAAADSALYAAKRDGKNRVAVEGSKALYV